MTDSFRQQYATPQDPFETWFYAAWRYAGRGRIVDPEVLALYRKALGHWQHNHLEAVYQEWLESNERASLPPVGTLKSIYHRRKSAQEAKRQTPQRHAPLSAKERARRKCKSALAQRLCGMTVETTPADGIDATWLASCVEVDLDHRSTLTSTEALRAHDAAAFRALDELFEEEWE